jgi:hypothetical protein
MVFWAQLTRVEYVPPARLHSHDNRTEFRRQYSIRDDATEHIAFVQIQTCVYTLSGFGRHDWLLSFGLRVGANVP